MFKVQNFWKILEGPGLSELGKSVLHGDDTSRHFMLISKRIFQSTVPLPVLCTDAVRRVPVGPGDTKNMQDHSDYSGALKTNRSTLDDAGPGKNILTSASDHSLPHSQGKMNHTGSRSSTSPSSQSGDSPKLTMWFSSFYVLPAQLPAATLIAQHTKPRVPGLFKA